MHHKSYAGRIRPINSKIMRRAICPVHHISYAGRSALLPAKWCAGRTALCIIFATQGGPPSYQQNGTQGGPPCALYKLCRAVHPPTSKMFHSQGRTIFQGQGEIKSIPEDDCSKQLQRLVMSQYLILDTKLTLYHVCMNAFQNGTQQVLEFNTSLFNNIITIRTMHPKEMHTLIKMENVTLIVSELGIIQDLQIQNIIVK